MVAFGVKIMGDAYTFVAILLIALGLGLVAAIVGFFLFSKDDWWHKM